jgi:hypothetical protein
MTKKCLVCGETTIRGEKHCHICGKPIEESVLMKKIVGNIVVLLFFILLLAGIGILLNYLMF